MGAQGCHHQYEGASNGVGSKGDLKPKNWLWGIWRLSSQVKVKVQTKVAKLTTWTFVAEVPYKVMVARFQFKHHVALLPC